MTYAFNARRMIRKYFPFLCMFAYGQDPPGCLPHLMIISKHTLYLLGLLKLLFVIDLTTFLSSLNPMNAWKFTTGVRQLHLLLIVDIIGQNWSNTKKCYKFPKYGSKWLKMSPRQVKQSVWAQLLGHCPPSYQKTLVEH